MSELIKVDGKTVNPAISVTTSVDPIGVLVTPTFAAATIVPAMNTHGWSIGGQLCRRPAEDEAGEEQRDDEPAAPARHEGDGSARQLAQAGEHEHGDCGP